jgi:hypothetical protein
MWKSEEELNKVERYYMRMGYLMVQKKVNGKTYFKV